MRQAVLEKTSASRSFKSPESEHCKVKGAHAVITE